MLRAVIALAVWVLSVGMAWADAAPPDASSLVRDYGGWGLSSLFATVIGILWFKSGAQAEEIKSLNKDLIAATGRAEKIAGDNTAALQAFDAAARVRAEKDAEKWASIKQLGEDATKTAMVVTSNATSMSRIEVGLETIRSAIVGLTKAVSDLATEIARGGGR